MEWNRAEQAGHACHACKRIEVAALDCPLLRRKEDFETGTPPEPIRQAQEAIRWADHIVILFPLWHGTMPALLKAFFEQVFHPGFALAYESGRMPRTLLTVPRLTLDADRAFAVLRRHL